jgi:signal transduction histidine kinase
MVPRWPDLWRDVVPGLAVTALVTIGTARMGRAADDHRIDALAFVCVGVACAALFIRRRWPVVVLAVVTAALLVYGLREYPGGPIYVTGAVALFSYAVTVDRRPARIVGSVLAVAIYLTHAAGAGELTVLGLLVFAWAAIAVLAADAVRSSTERRQHAVKEREDETLRRLAEDRLRIARDLHDSVAHAMTAINVQAGVAAHLLDRDPTRAGPALEAIRVASRDVLEELAAMLDVLRSGEPAPLAPLAQLADIDALVTSSQRAGLDVDLRRDGDLHAVPTAISTAAYRIVQEALTNVARHSGSTRARVSLAVGATGLSVEVLNAGSAGAARAQAGTGRGLAGIRERVANTGGKVELGPRPEGGFAVRVRWPFASSPSPTEPTTGATSGGLAR